MYDTLFWFNEYENLWYAFNRADYVAFFNGECQSFLSDQDFEKLVIKVQKTYE